MEVEGAFAHEDLDRLHDGVDVSIALYDPSRGNIADGALPVLDVRGGRAWRAERGQHRGADGDIATSEGIGVACTWNDADALVAALHNARGLTLPKTQDGCQSMRAAWLEAIEGLLA